MLLRTPSPPDTQHSPCPHHHHTRCVSSLHMQHFIHLHLSQRGNEPAVLSHGQFTSTPTSHTLLTQHKSEDVKHRMRMRRRGQISTWHTGCRVQGAGCEVPAPSAGGGAGAGPDRFCAAPARPPGTARPRLSQCPAAEPSPSTDHRPASCYREQ